MQQVIIRTNLCFLSSLFLLLTGSFEKFTTVGHTHDDIDALFGRWSMALKKESFLTIPLLMKLFLEVEAVPNIISSPY